MRAAPAAASKLVLRAIFFPFKALPPPQRHLKPRRCPRKCLHFCQKRVGERESSQVPYIPRKLLIKLEQLPPTRISGTVTYKTRHGSWIRGWMAQSTG